MKKKILKAGAVAAVTGMLFGAVAFAGTSTQDYATVVGRCNGVGYSRYQTKAVSGKDAHIYSNQVGGRYKVDVRMISSQGKGSWLRNVGDGTSKPVEAHSKHTKGSEVRLQFSNDALTLVTVHVDGTWKSN